MRESRAMPCPCPRHFHSNQTFNIILLNPALYACVSFTEACYSFCMYKCEYRDARQQRYGVNISHPFSVATMFFFFMKFQLGQNCTYFSFCRLSDVTRCLHEVKNKISLRRMLRCAQISWKCWCIYGVAKCIMGSKTCEPLNCFWHGKDGGSIINFLLDYRAQGLVHICKTLLWRHLFPFHKWYERNTIRVKTHIHAKSFICSMCVCVYYLIPSYNS